MIHHICSLCNSRCAVPTIPSTTRLGYVHLTVNSLDRQVQFYTRVLRLTLHGRKGSEAALGTETEVLLRLIEDHVARRVQTSGSIMFNSSQ